MFLCARRVALHLLASATVSTGIAASAMPVGFASLNGGTTGGSGGGVVTATSAQQFKSFANQSGPLTILVEGQFDIGGTAVGSDKTILGVGADAALTGSLQLSDVSNVIIRNLALSNPDGDGEGDAVTLRESTNVWIDHNAFTDAPDGLLDIVSESDYVTVSWNTFSYTTSYAQNVNTNHRFAMLIGNSDSATEDADDLQVTLHHNYFGDFVRERMPRVRYGDVHVFNNYVNTPGDNYAIRSALAAEVLVENNYFENVTDPYEKAQDGQIEASGNVFVNSGGRTQAGDDVFTPPYAYTLDNAADVKALVLAGAGVSAGVEGDYDNSGQVEQADLDFVLQNWGDTDVSDVTAWSNFAGLPGGNIGGQVEQTELDLVLSNWGGTSAPNFAGAAVPEPTGVLALAGWSVWTLRRRARHS